MSLRMNASVFHPEMDREGFLLDSEGWTEEVAETLAQGEVTGYLTEEHWKVITYLRRYYLRFNTVPPVKMLCRDTGLKFTHICELFPSGLSKGACKIAGIPQGTIKPVFHYP